MTDRGRVDYDHEWTTERGMPAGSRLRVGMTKERGSPIRFVVQLEYWHAGRWSEVARIDHDRDGPVYRNITRSGLHLDLYHPDHGQYAKASVSGPLPESQAMSDAEEYIRERAEQLVQRFERWL